MQKIFLSLIVCMTVITKVFAMDCAISDPTREVIEHAGVIFEGVAGDERNLNWNEKKALLFADFKTYGRAIRTMKAFEFTVTKAWKGVSVNDKITILRDVSWGDRFPKGVEFFIIPGKIGIYYVASLCSYAYKSEYARERGFLKILQE